MKNRDKIEKIIKEYRDTKIDSLDEFYQKNIYFQFPQNYIKCYDYKEPIDLNIKRGNPRHLEDKKLQNYTIVEVGNIGGKSYVIFKKGMVNQRNESWDLFRKKVLDDGMKLYLNIDFFETRLLKDDEFIQIYKKSLKRGDKLILDNELFEYESKSNGLDRESKDVYLIVQESNYFLLKEQFTNELFEKIDELNFVDVLGFKDIPSHHYRIDSMNFYISTKLKYNKSLLNQLVNIFKYLILKYQRLGLKFGVDKFIMPYRFDNIRVMANVYISDSFNKSLLYLILLYINPNEKLVDNFFEFNYLTKRHGYRDALKEYIRNRDSNMIFEKFVFDIFELYGVEDIDKGYLQSYYEMFEY